MTCREVATLLVGEVCQHKGQTDTVAGLVKLLNPVFQWKEGEEEVLATLVRERMEGKEEQDRENVGGLCLAVLREESHYSQVRIFQMI